MNNHFKINDVLSRLDENGIDYAVLPLTEGADDFKIVVSAHGGRVFGPFAGARGESYNWINSAFKSADGFKAFLKSGSWNIGGDRFWIAPEHDLFVRDKGDFYNSHNASVEIDPGIYTLKKARGRVSLSLRADAPVYRQGFARKSFMTERVISPAKNPLDIQYPALSKSVRFCGYTFDTLIKDLSPEKDMPLELWNLLQVNPGGKILVPYIGNPDFVDYYEPMDQACIAARGGYFELAASGCRRYKAAFYALGTTGRSVYVNKNEDGYYAIFKQYYNDPTNPYCCDPFDRPGMRGCSMYVYNDNGAGGGFTEFENSLPAVGKEAGRAQVSAQMSHLFFMGEKEPLERVITALTGIDYHISF